MVVAGAAALVPAAVAGGAKDIRGKSFSFTATNLLPPVGGFSEPSIALSPKDHVYFCGPSGLAVDGHVDFVRTPDWATFYRQDITDVPVGGGDCDIKVGPDAAVYEADLGAYGSAIRKSVDDGATFAQLTYDPVEQDRQWLAPDPVDGSIVYFAYHDFAAEQEILAKSLDGGKTFPIHTLASNDPLLVPDTGANTYSGPVRVDPTDHDNVAIVYGISSVGANTAACNADMLCFGLPKTLVVAVSHDGGLTFTDTVAMDVSDEPGDEILGNLFPWMTWDRAGNLYVMAGLGGTDGAGNRTNGIYYAFSSDKGAMWSPMRKVNAGGGAVVFPTMVGGSAGVVDFAWLESTAGDQNDATGTWTVHFAQTRNAATNAPTFTEVTGPAVRTGPICTLGILCSGGRELGDFMEIALDSFGYAHIAAPALDAVTSYDVWWRQDQGPSATSEPCTPACVKVRPGPQP
ncbi:MAG TPA: hypothetical protein VGK79_02990 [Gaiellaceae bacterium]